MARFLDCIKFLLGNERGSTAIVVAISMPLVVAGAAFGVETSFWYYKDMQLQAAADAAAYAGALEKRAGSNQAAVKQAATNVAVTNGFREVIGTAELNSPPLTGTHIGAKSVEVVLQEKHAAFLFVLLPENTGHHPSASGCKL